jgi:hypothetical protein
VLGAIWSHACGLEELWLPASGRCVAATEREHECDAADEPIGVVEPGLGSQVAAAALAWSAPRTD